MEMFFMGEQKLNDILLVNLTFSYVFDLTGDSLMFVFVFGLRLLHSLISFSVRNYAITNHNNNRSSRTEVI